jgi:hypothetical protein
MVLVLVLVLVPSMQILSKIKSIPMSGRSLNIYRAINFRSLNVTKFKNRQISILWKFFEKLEKSPDTTIIQKFKKLKDFHERAGKRTNDLLANYLIFYTF